MGGYHPCYRKSVASTYAGIETKVKLPSSAADWKSAMFSDHKKNVVPEIIIGVFGGGYGFDCGILYDNSKFIMFVYATPGSIGTVLLPDWITANVNLSFGSTIGMRTLVKDSALSFEVFQNSSMIGVPTGKLSVPLSQAAYTAMNKKCQCIREVVIAANANAVLNSDTAHIYGIELTNGYFYTDAVAGSKTLIGVGNSTYGPWADPSSPSPNAGSNTFMTTSTPLKDHGGCNYL